MSDPINETESLISATSAVLGLPVREEWKPTLTATLTGLLAMARFVEAYRLPDHAQPANVYEVER